MWRSRDERGDASGSSDGDDDPMSGGDNDAVAAPAPDTSAIVAPSGGEVTAQAACIATVQVAVQAAVQAAISTFAASREHENDTRLSQLEASKAAAELQCVIRGGTPLPGSSFFPVAKLLYALSCPIRLSI